MTLRHWLLMILVTVAHSACRHNNGPTTQLADNAPEPRNFVEHQQAIESSFARLAASKPEITWDHPLAGYALDPVVLKKSDNDLLHSECLKRIKTVRAFIDDVYAGGKTYYKVPHIESYLKTIALQSGLWDGQSYFTIRKFFVDHLKSALRNPHFTYGCDVVKINGKDEYAVIEDSATGALGGLFSVPDAHAYLEESDVALARYRHGSQAKTILADIVADIIRGGKPEGEGKHRKFILAYHNSEQRYAFIQALANEGFEFLDLDRPVEDKLIGRYLEEKDTHFSVINFLYAGYVDPLSNPHMFNNGLVELLKVTLEEDIYLTKDNFAAVLGPMVGRRFLAKHRPLNHVADIVADRRGNVVDAPGFTEVFDHKYFGLLIDELMPAYLAGETPKIKNPESRLFARLDDGTLDEALLAEIFAPEQRAKWVVKKSFGLAGRDVWVLGMHDEATLAELRKRIQDHPTYYFAQKKLDIATFRGMMYELRTLGYSSPRTTLFFPVPHGRGADALLTKGKSNVGSGGGRLPVFVVR